MSHSRLGVVEMLLKSSVKSVALPLMLCVVLLRIGGSSALNGNNYNDDGEENGDNYNDDGEENGENVNPTAPQRNETALVQLIANLIANSNNKVRPGVNGQATEVRIDFYVQSFGPLNEMMMEFAADLDFRQSWIDPRLMFNTTEPDVPVYIPHHSIDMFWIPDIYFPNENSGTTHQITLPNKSIRIYANGTVRYFSRMAMRLSCTMYLAKFPLDTQKCLIKISTCVTRSDNGSYRLHINNKLRAPFLKVTYSYDEKEVKLVWDDNTPIETHDLNLPQFSIVEDYPFAEECKEAYKTGHFSCLAAVFLLKRKVGFFVLQTFIPSMLIVMLSWVGFWINKRSEPARVALGVTTVLTMTTQLTSSASNQMKVSYPKAIDVWYSACMVFVFGALLEFAFVNVCTRSEVKLDGNDKKKAAAKDVEKQCSGSDSGDPADGQASGGQLSTDKIKGLVCGYLSPAKLIRDWHVTSKNIDRLSRRVFPLLFLIFNILFWFIYGVMYPDEHAD